MKRIWVAVGFSILCLVIAYFSSPVFATSSIGEIADNLMAPTAIITKMVLVACYIIGATLVFAALAQYKIHRQSPKLVPLSTPIALLILGVVSLLIPYATNMFGETFSAVEQDKGRSLQENLLPVPDTTRKGPSLPISPQRNQNQNTSQPAQSPVAPSSPSTDDPASQETDQSGGHWTNDS